MGFHVRYDDLGIKHDLLCINICWFLRVVLKHERVKQRFWQPQRPKIFKYSSKACFIAIIKLLHKVIVAGKF